MVQTQIALIMRILATTIQVANRAGTIVRDVMSKGELGIVEKSKNDLQTEADRSAQRCIIASMTNQFPNLKIIGEEGQSDLNVPAEWLVTDEDVEFLKNPCPNKYENLTDEQLNSLVLWVDPLDGTTEYTQGFLEHVTVLIGLSMNEEAIGGIIHQPYYKRDGQAVGRTIWGLKGLGVGGFEPIEIADDGKFIVTTTRTHSNDIVQNALDALKPTEIIRVGGAGYKVLQLLEGKAHAYVFASPGCKKWDTCAPEAVLEAHGGMLTDIRGNHYPYGANALHLNKFGVIGTAKTVSHQKIIDLIPENVKDAMKV